MKTNIRRAFFAVGLIAAIASTGCRPKPASGPSAPTVNPNAVKVELFVMSQCPFGVEAVNKIKEVVDKMGADIDFKLDFIGTIGQNGELSSMHGPNEVTGDIAQICAAKYAPAKYLDMILCQNKNYREVATNWEKCASDAKLPVDSIKACVNGPEGKQLLQASFERAKTKQASGSPTFLLNGKPYSGRRTPEAFMRAACAEYKDTKPQVCQNIPEPPKVNVTILADKRCTECNTEQLKRMLTMNIPAPVIKEIDYSDADGRKLYDELPASDGSGNMLPVVLFDSSLDADKDTANMLSRRLRPLGNYRSMTMGAWNPACANENGCNLAQCKDTFACRKEVPKRLEVFVMSQCPYGVRALSAMDEVLKAFDKKLDFQVHYIADNGSKGIESMHGQSEVDEDIRGLCAMKLYPKNFQWMDYVLCRNGNIRDSNWKSCTNAREGACVEPKDGDKNAMSKQSCEALKKIDAKSMEKCSTGDEGKQLLAEDLKIAKSLGIGASPTWVANGKFKFSGIDAETVRKNLCAKNNNEIKGCDKTLTGPNASGSVQGGCGK